MTDVLCPLGSHDVSCWLERDDRYTEFIGCNGMTLLQFYVQLMTYLQFRFLRD